MVAAVLLIRWPNPLADGLPTADPGRDQAVLEKAVFPEKGVGRENLVTLPGVRFV